MLCICEKCGKEHLTRYPTNRYCEKCWRSGVNERCLHVHRGEQCETQTAPGMTFCRKHAPYHTFDKLYEQNGRRP
jgi:hypothetical protein